MLGTGAVAVFASDILEVRGLFRRYKTTFKLHTYDVADYTLRVIVGADLDERLKGIGVPVIRRGLFIQIQYEDL